MVPRAIEVVARAEKPGAIVVAARGYRASGLDGIQAYFFASSEKSVGRQYAPMGAGSSARAAREPDVG